MQERTRQTRPQHRYRHRNLLCRNRIIASFGLLLLLTVLLCVPVLAEVDPYAEYSVESDEWPNWPEAPSMWGRTGCLMDAETGAVLYAKGAHAERFPASITKVMTAIIVLDHCGLDEIVTMTETGLADAYGDSSNINPFLGEQFTVDECLQMLLVKSANDVATQLAEYTAGSVAAFAELMNQRAADLGCTSTHFNNASGLEDDNHYTSAYDMCLIMREALNYGRFREIIAMPYVVIPETEYSYERYYETHVYLMQDGNPFYYEGCLGGKTGFTDPAQSTLVCAADRNGRVLIGTVMGAPDTDKNAEDMVDLFNYGYTYFNDIDVSRGTEMFTEPTPEPTPEPALEPEEPKTSPAVTAKPTTTPEVTADPGSVTTTDSRLELEQNKKRSSKPTSTRTIVYIVVICVLAAAILTLVLVQLHVNRVRKQNSKRKKR